jgi:hypothetical protein
MADKRRAERTQCKRGHEHARDHETLSADLPSSVRACSAHDWRQKYGSKQGRVRTADPQKEKYMTTYVQVKPPGYDRAIVVRTEESRQRASKRAILKTPNFTERFTAQEIANEKHLSRSKPYPNKGRNEAERRLRRMYR